MVAVTVAASGSHRARARPNAPTVPKPDNEKGVEADPSQTPVMRGMSQRETHRQKDDPGNEGCSNEERCEPHGLRAWSTDRTSVPTLHIGENLRAPGLIP
jgi:hypothetical protein